MLKKPHFAITLALGLTASPGVWTVAQAADPAPPPADSSTTQSAQTVMSAAKKELPFPNSKEWSTATEREKLAYLLGVMNMAMVEYQLSGPSPKHRTTVARMVKALDGMTLRQIMAAVDAYYTANPDQQQRPVFEVIWFELVAAKTKKG
jgi:hypothetical protein